MTDLVILIIIAVLLFFAVRGSISHAKGECGGCCGTCARPVKKKLEGKKIAEKTVAVEGMHCENCRNTVERAINRIDGAAAKVNLKKNTAAVSMSRMVSDEELTEAVERAGYKVTKITCKEG